MKKIITISREFGSGGHAIAEMLGDSSLLGFEGTAEELSELIKKAN